MSAPTPSLLSSDSPASPSSLPSSPVCKGPDQVAAARHRRTERPPTITWPLSGHPPGASRLVRSATVLRFTATSAPAGAHKRAAPPPVRTRRSGSDAPSVAESSVATRTVMRQPPRGQSRGRPRSPHRRQVFAAVTTRQASAAGSGRKNCSVTGKPSPPRHVTGVRSGVATAA